MRLERRMVFEEGESGWGKRGVWSRGGPKGGREDECGVGGGAAEGVFDQPISRGLIFNPTVPMPLPPPPPGVHPEAPRPPWHHCPPHQPYTLA